MSDIRQWLDGLGLVRYADQLEANDVDLETLDELSDQDLKDLGVASLGHRRKLLKAIRERAPARGGALRTPPRHIAERILSDRSALEGERKQVTILFADVAGFTRLSERLDPEAVHDLMDGCFAILGEQVHRYEGTINLYAGDGIMALFGAPIAHEDHALRAAHAALDIQSALADYGTGVERRFGLPFRMRVGLNTGPVVVGQIGDDLRMDYTALGDTVNLAARLEEMAEAGQILVSERTRRIAGDLFEWVELGERSVRGKGAPVIVFRLAGRGRAQGRLDVLARQGLTPMVGRGDELDSLTAAWAAARGGAGRVVSVVGEAGLGKSRLLYEFKRHLDEAGARHVEGTCFTYGEGISYLPFLAIVRGLCGIADADAEPEGKQAIAATLERLQLDPDAVAPYLHNLLSHRVDDELFPRLTPELVRRRTVEALSALLLAEAGDAPLAVVIEDVHWIDRATEEVVGVLVEALAESAMLLVLVYRPEYLNQWSEEAHHAEVLLRRLPSATGAEMVRAILNRPYAEHLALEPLSAGESMELARQMLGESGVTPEVERLILDRTEGNPLFVEELTRALVEGGALSERAGAYALAHPSDELEIPATLQGVLLARIDRLSRELKETLRVAAAIGRVFSAAVLVEASPVDSPVDDLLERLQDLDFVYRLGPGPDGDYSFKHVLAQEAVYSTLLKSRRAAYHEAIGTAIEDLYADRLEEHAEVLARHFDEAERPDRAVDYLIMANAKAVRSNAVAEAHGYFTRAHELFQALPPTDENRAADVQLLCDNVLVFQLLFLYGDYYGLLNQALPVAREVGSAELEGRVLNRMGHMEWAFGDLETSTRNAHRAVELLTTEGTGQELAYCHTLLGYDQLVAGDFDELERSEALSLAACERGFDLRWFVWTLSFASMGYAWRGRFADAIERGERALAVADEYADASLVCFASWVLGIAHTIRGDVTRALPFGTRAVAVAPTPSDQSWAGATNAWFMCRAGRVEEGIVILEEAVAANRAAQFLWSEVMATYLAEGYIRSGRLEEARRILGEALDFCRPRRMRHTAAVAERLMGDALRLADGGAGRLEAARAQYERALEACRAIGAENELAHALEGLGRLHLDHGDPDEGRRHLEDALAIYERLGALGAPDAVRASLG